MRFSQRNSPEGSARAILLLALVGVLALVTLILWLNRPAHVVSKRQASLIEGIERRSGARISRLLADDYGDRWDFTREEAVEALLDAGSQFLTLVVTPETVAAVINGDRAVVTARLVVSGKPLGPIGTEVTTTVNRLAEPFIFTWEKQSFLPSSWRLISVENAALPAELYGYAPGDLRRAMRGE